MRLTSLTDRAGALHWSLRQDARRLDNLAGKFRQMATNPEIQEQARAFVPIISELARITHGLARIAERIALGEGE